PALSYGSVAVVLARFIALRDGGANGLPFTEEIGLVIIGFGGGIARAGVCAAPGDSPQRGQPLAGLRTFLIAALGIREISFDYRVGVVRGEVSAPNGNLETRGADPGCIHRFSLSVDFQGTGSGNNNFIGQREWRDAADSRG